MGAAGGEGEGRGGPSAEQRSLTQEHTALRLRGLVMIIITSPVSLSRLPYPGTHRGDVEVW